MTAKWIIRNASGLVVFNWKKFSAKVPCDDNIKAKAKLEWLIMNLQYMLVYYLKITACNSNSMTNTVNAITEVATVYSRDHYKL